MKPGAPGHRHPTIRIDPATVRSTLRAAGLRARPGLSQNFLADAEVLDDIVAVADPRAGRRVLEIGPGLGILTDALLGAGATVTAVELDHGLATFLRGRHADALALGASDPAAPGALQLIEGDALDQDLGALVRPPYDVVANLPYHVTSPVLHRLLGAERTPERLVLMVQREVAERVAAPPGRLSYLSVYCQYHARVRIARLVPSTAFDPAPKVESAVLVLEPFSAQDADAPARLDHDAEDELWRIVQSAFRERRKMLHNVLARQLPLPAARVDAALAAAGIAPERRPQTVSVAEWLTLREALGPIGPDTRGLTGGERAALSARTAGGAAEDAS